MNSCWTRVTAEDPDGVIVQTIHHIRPFVDFGEIWSFVNMNVYGGTAGYKGPSLHVCISRIYIMSGLRSVLNDI